MKNIFMHLYLCFIFLVYILHLPVTFLGWRYPVALRRHWIVETNSLFSFFWWAVPYHQSREPNEIIRQLVGLGWHSSLKDVLKRVFCLILCFSISFRHVALINSAMDKSWKNTDESPHIPVHPSPSPRIIFWKEALWRFISPHFRNPKMELFSSTWNPSSWLYMKTMYFETTGTTLSLHWTTFLLCVGILNQGLRDTLVSVKVKMWLTLVLQNI